MEDDKKIFSIEEINENIEVFVENETVWLNQKQMAELFDKSPKTINEHINNIYKEGELDENGTIRKFQIVGEEGTRSVKRNIDHYNLDVIISVGYRVKSKRGTQFRIWANNILKEYLLKGAVINKNKIDQKQLDELKKAIEVIQNVRSNNLLNQGELDGLLEIIVGYSNSWMLLQQYDEQSLKIKSKDGKTSKRLEYEEAKRAINEFRNDLIEKGEASELFGRERGGGLEAVIKNIYQTFGGEELYKSSEEKASHLLYFVIKDHPLVDGNKRVGSFLFLLFLKMNLILDENKINQNSLVAIALLVAESKPEQKETIIKLIINFLQ